MTTIKIISKENIKPSSPTPQHLKRFNLSVLHQLIPSPYAPLVFFYPNKDNASELQLQEQLELLKISLSQTLMRFYPLAGTSNDDLAIDCDDVGAYYVTAHVDTGLSEFLRDLDLDLINKFLPCDPSFVGLEVGVRVSNVQVNIFECGGVAIGFCISHKVLDCSALATFVKCWASVSLRMSMKKVEEVVYPDLTTHFLPANDSRLRDSSMAMWARLIKFGKCSTRRFVFDHSAITKLKTMACTSGVRQPTRVEVVSAFLWKCIMVASKELHDFKKLSLLGHMVNIRKRPGTLLQENSIGNLVWIASTKCVTINDFELHHLVNQVRGSILEINSEFVTELQGDKGPQVMEESLKRMKDCATSESVDYIGFTSWCKMGFYDVDFGWGEPVWVCGSVSHGSPMFTDFVVLMDTKYGNGIEAWVNMDEQKMHTLEHNPELLAFTSLDPSPLHICKVDH